jgi:hypothetical protein
MYKIKFPKEMEKMMESNLFDHTLFPEYYKKNEGKNG